MKRILIVDDEHDIRQMMGMIADHCNVAYDKASDGEEALRMVEKSLVEDFSYSLILMDVNMAIMTGAEATIAIHKICPEVPIALVSAVSESVVNDCHLKDHGVCAFVDKPFVVADITNIILKYAFYEYDGSEKRDYTRYCNGKGSLTLQFGRSDTPQPSNGSIELLDVSRTGLRFKTKIPLDRGQQLSMSIAFESDNVSVERNVRVIWQKEGHDSPGAYVTGVQFSDAANPYFSDKYLSTHLEKAAKY